MKHILIILVAAAAMLVSSCASQRALSGDVQGVSAKLDAQFKAFNLDEGANGTIKMKRNEGIQISLTKFGIEGVRIICTTDSVLFVNKLTKTYLRTSYREIDKQLGGEGTFNFNSLQAYFWNDNGRLNDYATLPIGGFIPLDLKTSYGRGIRAGQYRVPRHIALNLSGADGAIETGKAKLKLSKVKAVNDWHPTTEVSAKYKQIDIKGLISKYLKKK